MINSALFVTTILIWGTTWIAIAFQVGEVAVTVSILYRFALASGLMLAGLAILGRLRRPTAWRYVIVQALCLFCFNFICLYHATTLIPSAQVAVVFSLASIFNALNARLFFGDRLSARTILAGSLGVAGLGLLFWKDLTLAMDGPTARGVGWALLGTLFFSWGAVASRRNLSLGVSPVIANAWGMGVGAATLLAIVLLADHPIRLPVDATYWWALLYLAAVGSVLGFTTYLLLAARVGSAKAGYATVLFPIVALLASTLFEGYQWSPTAAAGVALALLGNLVMFSRRRG